MPSVRRGVATHAPAVSLAKLAIPTESLLQRVRFFLDDMAASDGSLAGFDSLDQLLEVGLIALTTATRA